MLTKAPGKEKISVQPEEKTYMTNIVNIKNSRYDVYIGRPSLFGNPFKIGTWCTREQAIKKYKEYFYRRINQDPHFKQEVHKLKGKTLGCYCRPQPCHGDVIVEYLEREE